MLQMLRMSSPVNQLLQKHFPKNFAQFLRNVVLPAAQISGQEWPFQAISREKRIFCMSSSLGVFLSSSRFLIGGYHSNQNVYETNSPEFEVCNGKNYQCPSKILLIFKSVVPMGDLALRNRHTGTLVGKLARITELKFRGI